MRMPAVVVVVVVLWSCKKEPPERPPPQNTAQDAAPQVRAGATCTSPNDCTFTNRRSATDCCGDPCDAAEPIHEDDLEALQAELAKHCPPGSFDCPVADCDLPKNLYPGCVDGKCVSVELPRRTECKADPDCKLSCYGPASCCGSCTCDNAWHVDDFARASAWRSESCDQADCPTKKCDMPTTQARCENGWCVAK